MRQFRYMTKFQKTKLLGLAIALGLNASASAQMMINGAGATFPYPIYSKWFDAYAKVDPSVRFNYQSIGSGGGQKQILSQTVDFGASDGPMSDENLAKAPGKLLHIPTVAGAMWLLQSAWKSGAEIRRRHDRRGFSGSDQKMERSKANSVKSGRKVARSGHRSRASI